MKESKETFKTLWEYCVSRNRLCLKLKHWNQLFKLLKNTEKLNGHGDNDEPADPVIIDYNWYNIIPIEKQFQFKSYIKWAEKNDQLEEIGEYLRFLSEEDWEHFGEG
ncbi:MAG: hypothetical protein WC123_04320 [Bacilli bacterium]|nr:hypothetical protein [Bacilli bacterium]